MDTGSIEVDVPLDGVAVLSLNRPPVNAMSRDFRRRLVLAVDLLQDRSDVAVIVLTGRGKVFSAGADIKERDALAADPGGPREADRLARDSFYALLDSSKPLIAAVNGAALGAGFVMAACCDVVIAAESAFFAMPEVDVGLGGGASFLQRMVPLPLLRLLVLSGERVSATQLGDAGAIMKVVPDSELLSQAVTFAGKIAAKNPAAVRAIRESLEPVRHLGLREGFQLEQRYTRELSRSQTAQQQRRAFLDGQRG